MTVLYNHAGDLIAYIYHNAILQPGTFVVKGLVLGNCVFSTSGILRGKFIHQKLYDESGEILATRQAAGKLDRLDESGVLSQAWNLLGKIRFQDFPWILPGEKWSRKSLQSLLQ